MNKIKSVLITGASTGIGEATALYLDRMGFQVFAGIRRQDDADKLRKNGSDRLTPIFLDVTDPTMIQTSVKTVSGAVGDFGLDGLVNNAGISQGGPLEFIKIDDLRKILETNTVAPVAITQAFLPLLRKAKGRVINMGSISGRLALPLLGPYAMSKYGLEAFTDSLRREVSRWGIKVSILEPGHISTPIWSKARERITKHRQDWPAEFEPLYGKLLDEIAKNIAEETAHSLPPEAVAKVVHQALTAKRPRTRYVVGKDARLGIWLTRLLSDRMVDYLIQQKMKID